MTYATNIFQSAYTQARGSSGQRLALPHRAAIGAPARPARSILWVSLLAAMLRVTIARAGELVMLPVDCA